MKAILEGLLTVLKHAFRPRVTLLYPETKRKMPEEFRGAVDFDPKKCIGCELCKKLCPSFGTIKIEDKKVVSVDLSRCISCGNCAYNCPKQAIFMTKRYELATDDKKVLLSQKKDEKQNGN